MQIIGLTGGIGTGKSTVSQMFRNLGATVIDADQLAREVVEPGQPALDDIAARFPGVIREDGCLDRKKLGERVFAEPAERAALNDIIHPHIQKAFLEKTAQLLERGVTLVIYDAPLLIESGMHQWISQIVVVDAPAALQRQRLIARDGLSSQEIDRRIAAQLPMSEKRKHARWVIDNSGSLEATRAQVAQVWNKINHPT